MGIKTCSSTKLRVSLVSLGVFNVYCGNEGKKIFRVGVLWVINIFAGCSWFGREWMIREFSFKSAISSVSATMCFGGCG